MWQALRSYFTPKPLATADALRAFLERRASFIAQKCAIDYVRGKTGLASHALFTKKTFLDALAVCRWEAFAAILGDLLILAESQLRAHASAEQLPRLRAALAGLYPAILGALPMPAHRADWSEATAAFAQRFGEATRAGPRQALDVADHSAKRLFDTLPIHISMRDLDEEVVYGAVRFRMIAISQELQRRLDAAEVVRQLLA